VETTDITERSARGILNRLADAAHMGRCPALPGRGLLACDFFEMVTLSGRGCTCAR